MGEAFTRICDGRAVKRRGRRAGAATPTGRLKPDTAKEAMAADSIDTIWQANRNGVIHDDGSEKLP